MTKIPGSDDLAAPRPRVGQIVLAGIIVVAIMMLIVWSFAATRAHEIERATVFAEEADSTAMTFVQRESFNTLLQLERWSTGEATPRDVQIARANLGQRLGVRVASGATTGEIVHDGYREALVALDPYLLALGDVDDQQRSAVRAEMDPVVQRFLSQTRELSAVFQALTRQQVTDVLEDRAQAERWQAILAAVVLVAGLALAVWIARDINIFYRRARQDLAVERQLLEEVRGRITALQMIGRAATNWREHVDAELPRDRVIAMIRRDVEGLLPGVAVRLDSEGPAGVSLTGDLTGLDGADIDYVCGRVSDALQALAARQRSREELEHERVHDALTGLPNRLQLASTLAAACGQHDVVCVAVLDVDRFTEVNTAFGEAAGDEVLRTLARTLEPAPDVAVLRLASDDFALVTGSDSEESALLRVRRAINSIPPAITVGRGVAPLTVSVGVALARMDATAESDDLFSRALAALQISRTSSGRNEVVVFDEKRHADLLVRVTEEAELRKALNAGDIDVVLQPIVDLNDASVVGVEALARWYREGEVVPPNRFLPILHRSDLFERFTDTVIDRSLTAWKRIADAVGREAGDRLNAPYVAINIHAHTLAKAGFADMLTTRAAEAGVPPRNVVVEITEDAIVDAPVVLTTLEMLRRRGFRIAVDDFGTGYSSLGQAATLPLDILKIDRSFIPGVGTDPAATRLFGDLVGIGRTLDTVLVAEGVETEAVARELAMLGVDCAQGFLFSRPLLVEDLVQWLLDSAPSASPQ